MAWFLPSGAGRASPEGRFALSTVRVAIPYNGGVRQRKPAAAFFGFCAARSPFRNCQTRHKVWTADVGEHPDRPLNFILVAAVRQALHPPHRGVVDARTIPANKPVRSLPLRFRSHIGSLEGYEAVAMMVSVRSLRGIVNSSPRSMNPDSVLPGCRLGGSGMSGRSERKGAWPPSSFRGVPVLPQRVRVRTRRRGVESPVKLAEINIHSGRQ